MLRAARLLLTAALLSAALAGCHVVPAPPPPPGAPLAVPPSVQARPECGWTYGYAWYGWGWYSSLPC
jgi:hypothetical protein